MLETFDTIFSYFVAIYSTIVLSSYVAMAILAFLEHRKHYTYHDDAYTIDELKKSPYTPGISIVAPAYNEEKTVITNVKSLLSLDYPDFEVVIVNDGSKDKTLELLIENFDLVKVPYAYVEKIKTKPFRGLYKTKSDNPSFKRLTVVDKVNGGTKADASNAGINVLSNKFFVCTDVDCVLDQYALYRIIWPTMASTRRVIAVSATMRMSNGSIVEEGKMVEPASMPCRMYPAVSVCSTVRLPSRPAATTETPLPRIWTSWPVWSGICAIPGKTTALSRFRRPAAGRKALPP